MIWRYLLYFVLAYLALCLFVFFFQRRLLFIPSHHHSPEKAAMFGMQPWAPTSKGYLGFVGGRIDSSAKGTFLVFHGNAGSALDRFYYVDALGNLGYRVIIAEYPGYGARIGSPSETALVNGAEEMIQHAKNSFPGPLFLWGESLGAGVVAAVVKKTSHPIDGVVLLTPWYSLPEVAQSVYWFLPAKWLVKDRFESGKNLEGYAGSAAVLLAEHDEIIPIRHGEKLYQSLQTRKQRWLFQGAGHNSWPSHTEASWWQEVIDFLVSQQPPNP